jgi:hypothetical protein
LDCVIFPPAGCHFHISAQETNNFDEPLGRVTISLRPGRNTKMTEKCHLISSIYLFIFRYKFGWWRVAATKSATGLGLSFIFPQLEPARTRTN